VFRPPGAELPRHKIAGPCRRSGFAQRFSHPAAHQCAEFARAIAPRSRHPGKAARAAATAASTLIWSGESIPYPIPLSSLAHIQFLGAHFDESHHESHRPPPCGAKWARALSRPQPFPTRRRRGGGGRLVRLLLRQRHGGGVLRAKPSMRPSTAPPNRSTRVPATD